MSDQGVDAAAAARLATATRAVIDRVRRSAASPETMDAAARALEEVAARLESDVHPGPYMQRGLVWDGEMAEIEHPIDFEEFFPYSPLVGPRNPVSPPMRFEEREGRLLGRVTFGAAYTGPPGSVHGGVIASAFDELLGSANLVNGTGGMTGTLTVRYRRPTPVDAPIELEGWVERTEGRKIFTRGEMRHAGTVTAEAEGIFVQGSMEKLRAAIAAA
ncbi:MAG: PaaI family thioesterase [Myxococcota bacterium]